MHVFVKMLLLVKQFQFIRFELIIAGNLPPLKRD